MVLPVTPPKPLALCKRAWTYTYRQSVMCCVMANRAQGASVKNGDGNGLGEYLYMFVSRKEKKITLGLLYQCTLQVGECAQFPKR